MTPDVRNRDLPDLLVNTQRATDPAVPADASSLQRYLGLEDSLTLAANTVTITASSGLHYYCRTDPTAVDIIKAGYWVCRNA